MLKKELKEAIVWCAKHKHLVDFLINPDSNIVYVGFAAIANPRTPLNRVRDKSRHIIKPVDGAQWEFVKIIGEGKDRRRYYKCLECQKKSDNLVRGDKRN